MSRAVLVAAALFMGAFFFWLAGPGLGAYFFPDDMMNLYGCWSQPVSRLVADNLLLVTAVRPLGAVFYRPLFAWFGFNPLPFRAVCFTLLLVNLYLGYAVARRLSGSVEIALLAALAGAYHASFSDLYYSSGTIYELLCYLCYFGALLYYVRLRQAERVPGTAQLAVLGLVSVAALDAKEMAVTLPLMLAAYEWLFHRERSWRGAAVAAAVTTVFVLGRVFGPASLASNAAYRAELSLHAFLDTWSHYLNMLFYVDQKFTPAMAAGLLAALAVAAWASRSAHLKFCWLLIVIGMLPVSFIAKRSLYVIYVPFLGWTLYAATLLQWASVAIAPRWRGRAAALFLATAAALAPLHAWRTPYAMQWTPFAQQQVRTTLEQFSAQLPSLPRGAKILFLDDPLPADDWLLTFILRLHYRDATLEVARARRMDHVPTAQEQASHDVVVRYSDWRLELIANRDGHR